MTGTGGGRSRPRPAAVVVIVLSQWLGTSLWFSPSGATEDLSRWLRLDSGDFGWLLAATQLGFILGTLVLTLTGVADRFAAERVFAAGALAGAVLNCAWTWADPGFAVAWAARFGVGIALAGIYPMGMKMIVRRVGPNAGWALGWLVAMLTLGTAMPHILRSAGAALPWQAVIWGSSVLALLAAVLVLLIQEPRPAAPPPSSATPPERPSRSVRTILALADFRASCAAYLGHMWELYAFWSVVPLLCARITATRGDIAAVAALSAGVIAAGSLGCVLGGILSRRHGSEAIAALALAGSGLTCLGYPLIPDGAAGLKTGVLALWGFLVVADSPQFSAMSARYVPSRLLGTALTAQNSAGFLVTVVSILLLQNAMDAWGDSALWLLLPGPALGLLAMRPLLTRPRTAAAVLDHHPHAARQKEARS
ncbi:MFS transporter [Kitasatospora sp. NPDC057500]|uniref:MFS transporter n=1 Tax=Kitasatospora sp. NPDC057500 TaxID=3346151 RepID=UPI003699BCF4